MHMLTSISARSWAPSAAETSHQSKAVALISARLATLPITLHQISATSRLMSSTSRSQMDDITQTVINKDGPLASETTIPSDVTSDGNAIISDHTDELVVKGEQTVPPSMDGIHLERFLLKLFRAEVQPKRSLPGRSERGHFLVNGNISKLNYKLKAGDTVCVMGIEERSLEKDEEADKTIGALRVLAEGNTFKAVSKDVGVSSMLIAREAKKMGLTLMNEVDRGASGIFIFAKDNAAFNSIRASLCITWTAVLAGKYEDEGHITTVEVDVKSSTDGNTVRKFFAEKGAHVIGLGGKFTAQALGGSSRGLLMAVTRARFIDPDQTNGTEVDVRIPEPYKFETTRNREQKFFDDKERQWLAEIAAANVESDAMDTETPAGYITGQKEFCGRTFSIGRGVLIPRTSTGTLVTTTRQLPLPENPRILDLGTGSGCILVSLLCDLKGSTGVGVDMNEKAIEYSNKNGILHDVQERVEWICGDMRGVTQTSAGGPFDVIVSNPPYISESLARKILDKRVLEHEPREALIAGDDGCEFYQIIKEVVEKEKLLKENGYIVLEVGTEGKDRVKTMFDGWKVDAHKDGQGLVRCLVMRK
ncbi:protein-(glutamine-N5) methyltransferase [Planoprotostelium fungivorum]|uniref:Protein-(Glutamine-N5) methyltransferase n=1 Tax=Planoprotostelium fungivorum TaxID=1890364 RepID=A0A2P6NAW7_9EUKA|nr:protein-(glutamine-N5) methyltransferase [Planoprotostelium fungivorum]